jgi:hypothetical protein
LAGSLSLTDKEAACTELVMLKDFLRAASKVVEFQISRFLVYNFDFHELQIFTLQSKENTTFLVIQIYIMALLQPQEINLFAV